jgi:hypothetical protein
MYRRLEFFNQAVSVAHSSVWWIVCRRAPSNIRHCKTVVKLLTGEDCLNSNRGRFVHGAPTGLCFLCEAYEQETVTHLLTKCNAVRETRELLWRSIEESAPTEWLNIVSHMTHNEQTVFLLSGFGPYVTEWQPLYEAVAQFISGLYKKRCSLLDLDSMQSDTKV